MEGSALEGLKVVELAWVFMGPLVTKVLADFGAEVIKVESQSRPDVMRSTPPFADGKPGMNRSGGFSFLNSGKLSLTLNLDRQEGVRILGDLLRWADVVVEGFTPGMARKWGVTYEKVKEVNPGIVMVSTSMHGQTGPHSRQKGFGSFFQALPGFYKLTGRPGGEPPVPATAYTDFIAPWYALVAILGALGHRRRTGRGQYVDLSQLETSTQFLSPAILDYTCNGREQTANENRSSGCAPHNVYRCRGDDRWCAIAISSDAEWQSFLSIVESPLLAARTEFATFRGRKRHEEELDRLIGEWTVRYSPEEIVTRLQQRGIAAGIVRNGQDLSEDRHLRETGFFESIVHPEMGRTTYARAPFTLSRTPARLKASPCLGEHTEYVCTHLLGMTEEKFVELLNAGVLL